jgi:hypothetical protein
VRAAYEAVGVLRPATVIKTGGEGAIAISLSAAAVTAERFSGGAWRPINPAPSRAVPPPSLIASATPRPR